MIATLARQAREKGIDVMVVTGDRDMFQIVGDGVQVMATSRGITETKIYDRQAVIDRYGIPPELIPDFYGLKGDTSDNIPGVPGIGDKTASDLLQRFGDLETVLASIDEISGAKRKENLTEPRRRRAHVEGARDDPARRAGRRSTSTELPRRRARPLGHPRDVPRVRAARPAAPARGGARRRTRRRAPRAVRDRDRGARRQGRAGRPVAARRRARRARGRAARRPDEQAQGELLPAEPRSRCGSRPTRAADVLVGEAETLAAVTMGWGERPLVAHDWKSIAAPEEPCPTPPLEHDTLVAAYLLDPAGRAYPLDELLENEGIGVTVKGANGLAAGRGGHARARRAPARAARGAGPDAPPARGRAAARRRADRDGARGREARREARRGDLRRASRSGSPTLEREIWDLAGEEFTIGSPQQLSEILFNKLGLSKKRRGKTGFSTDARVLQAIRGEHAIIEKIEDWRELSKLKSTYLDALPELIDARTGRLHTTFNQTATTTGRLSSTNPNLQNVPIRTELGREIRVVLRRRGGPQADLGRLLAGRAARARAHRRRGRAEGDLPPRRGRAHRDRGHDPRHRARGRRPGHALEGEDGQLRDRLRPLRLRPGRPAADPAGRGAGVHRPLPRRLPEGQGVHRLDDRARDARRATSRRCSAASAGSRSCARGSGPRARSASGSRSTR